MSVNELDNIDLCSNIALSIYHFNIRSLSKNSSELLQFIQSIIHDFNVLVLSKCGLYIFTAIIAGYTFYHDLPPLGSVDSVVIYVINSNSKCK